MYSFTRAFLQIRESLQQKLADLELIGIQKTEAETLVNDLIDMSEASCFAAAIIAKMADTAVSVMTPEQKALYKKRVEEEKERSLELQMMYSVIANSSHPQNSDEEGEEP